MREQKKQRSPSLNARRESQTPMQPSFSHSHRNCKHHPYVHPNFMLHLPPPRASTSRSTRRIPKQPPMLLHVMRARRVRRPQIIKRLKQHQILRQRSFQRRNGNVGIMLRGHSNPIRVPARRPPALRHNRSLPASFGRDLVHPALDPGAGVLR